MARASRTHQHDEMFTFPSQISATKATPLLHMHMHMEAPQLWLVRYNTAAKSRN